MPDSPLADAVRPQTLSEVVGQRHLLGENCLFRKTLERGRVPNMIFYGPSGTGKTTVAGIVARNAGMTLRKINATNASLSDVKDVLGETDGVFGADGILLYLDEIQYFNKKQQQSLLEFIEDGRVTLIASTTDNPYFSVYPAVLSRCSVFEFKPVEKADILIALRRVYKKLCQKDGLWKDGDIPTDALEALDYIAGAASGDVRRAVGALELCYTAAGRDMTAKLATESLSGYALKMDRDGNEHYDLLSAFQKSIRGSDENAALFYLARLLEAGDLLSPIRRLLVIASEDIGLACPTAAVVVKACCDNAVQLGLPEGRIPLAEAVVYLATLPKSNASYMAYAKAAADVNSGKGLHIPDYIRDANQPSADKNRAYKYPHDYPKHYVRQTYLPEDIADHVYYTYADNKVEQAAKAYWDGIKGNKGE